MIICDNGRHSQVAEHEDIHSQRIPEDTGKVFSILLGILGQG